MERQTEKRKRWEREGMRRRGREESQWEKEGEGERGREKERGRERKKTYLFKGQNLDTETR